MSQLDVVKSFLRSAARSASARFEQLGVGTSVRETVSSLLRQRLRVADARLTAAVARAPEVTAATVSTREGKIRVHASYENGSTLNLSLVPVSVTFAPHGAKEWSVRVEPSEAALDPRSADVVSALAGELARTLWGPFLRRKAERGRGAFTNREGDLLIVDLRSLPEVRLAQGQPLTATAIDALALGAVQAEEGGLRLVPAFVGMPL